MCHSFPFNAFREFVLEPNPDHIFMHNMQHQCIVRKFTFLVWTLSDPPHLLHLNWNSLVLHLPGFQKVKPHGILEEFILAVDRCGNFFLGDCQLSGQSHLASLRWEVMSFIPNSAPFDFCTAQAFIVPRVFCLTGHKASVQQLQRGHQHTLQCVSKLH